MLYVVTFPLPAEAAVHGKTTTDQPGDWRWRKVLTGLQMHYCHSIQNILAHCMMILVLGILLGERTAQGQYFVSENDTGERGIWINVWEEPSSPDQLSLSDEMGRVADPERVKAIHFGAAISVVDSDLPILERFSNLERLSLTGCSVTDDGVHAILACKKLRDLRLVDTKLTKSGVKELVANLPLLRKLSLSGPKIDDACLRILGKQTKLRDLSVSGPRVTSDGICHLRRLRNLREVSLFGSAVNDQAMRCLVEAENLKTLYLVNTTVTDKGVASISAL